MDTSGLLVLIFMVMTPSECSETAEPQCKDLDKESFILLEGEAFYCVPYEANVSDEGFTWYKNGSQIEHITTDKNETVHSDGGALIFLNLHTENSGFYIGRQIEASGKCYRHHVKIDVFKSHKEKEKALYGEIKNSDTNKMIPCPDPVNETCDMLKGQLTWKKDLKLLPGHHETDLRVPDATKDDEGIYTCICTWTYNHKVYKSSGSRWLRLIQAKSIHRKPVIISPTDKELFADEGYETKLICSVFCGTTQKHDCKASWRVNFNPTDGYHQTNETVIESPSNNTISTATLTIEKVSAKDFQAEFNCTGEGFYETVSGTFTLKRRESIIPLVIRGVCVCLFFVFAAVLVKCFAIDLALFFRRCLPLRNKDPRVYDAYVVYQMQTMDKVTEDTLCQFVTKNLPNVLEEKCGYRLFIHGRDDIPGEDRLELVEDRIKQSRRLMVILTPGSGPGPEITDQRLASPENTTIGGFDWQVGLHHVLIQRELSVILIQLGDTGPEGYTHLPPGLQHLIRKSAPIRWPEGSQAAVAWNSRFWKRVRYLMPATPATTCPQSDII